MFIGIEWIAAGVLIAVAVAVYALGSDGKRRHTYGSDLRKIEEYRPPVSVVLKYRNASGVNSERRVAVLRSLRSRQGHLYLLGVFGKRRNPRVFRVDRIVSVKSADGRPLDTRRFLIDRLSIPHELCA
ncbi:MAG: WYL domain-containing protein [Rhodovibrionaceae bacterium]